MTVLGKKEVYPPLMAKTDAANLLERQGSCALRNGNHSALRVQNESDKTRFIPEGAMFRFPREFALNER